MYKGLEKNIEKKENNKSKHDIISFLKIEKKGNEERLSAYKVYSHTKSLCVHNVIFCPKFKVGCINISFGIVLCSGSVKSKI